MVAGAWASSNATRPGPSSTSQAIDSRLPAGWPSSRTRPARATRSPVGADVGPGVDHRRAVEGHRAVDLRDGCIRGVVAERPGRQSRRLVDEELDAGEQDIAVALDGARAATDRRIAGLPPDVDFRRSQFLGRVVLDEARIADLDIRGLGRPQSQDLDRRPAKGRRRCEGVVAAPGTVCQIAIEAPDRYRGCSAAWTGGAAACQGDEDHTRGEAVTLHRMAV